MAATNSATSTANALPPGNDAPAAEQDHSAPLAEQRDASFCAPDTAPAVDDGAAEGKPKYGWRFWLIFPALCATAFLASLEATLVSTALPTINRDIQTGDNYVWVINAFFLTSAAFQPLYGQLANILGRRWVMIVAVVIFIVGSAVGGAAKNPSALIAGRAIQGTGSGGMVMMLDLIVSDLVPVRQRPAFMGINFAAVNIGTALGPFVGGSIVDTISWRWVFYINIPTGGFALLVILLFLNTNYRRDLVAERLRRIDFIGNALLVAATIAVLFGLTYGGARYAWSSWHVLVPLILGILGYGVFVGFEASKFPSEPVLPLRLFGNRTSAAAYFVTFIWSILSMWRIYFLAVYFQSVKTSSPTRAGVQLLPSVLMLFPAVAVSGAFVKKTGKLLPPVFASLSLMVVGHGVYSILDSGSSTATWVLLQIVTGFFSNLLLPCLLPAVQAGLSEKDTAAATAFWGFLRSFGIIWGVTIPAIIFNNRFDQLADSIHDTAVRAELVNGQAYEHASKDFVNSLPRVVRGQVIDVYTAALRRTWQVSIAFAGIALLASFLWREQTLRTTVESEYGLKKTEVQDVVVAPENHRAESERAESNETREKEEHGAH